MSGFLELMIMYWLVIWKIEDQKGKIKVGVTLMKAWPKIMNFRAVSLLGNTMKFLRNIIIESEDMKKRLIFLFLKSNDFFNIFMILSSLQSYSRIEKRF